MSQQPRFGVLLSNLGTPDAPTAKALRRYLAEFLWDPRVVDAPRPLWWLVLNGIILTTRPRRSAATYRKIWTDEGSPLLSLSRKQQVALREALYQATGERIPVALGMRYGNPSLESALTELENSGVERVLVLPLYPQYSATTNASTYDGVTALLRRRRLLPELRFIRDYHDDDHYIDALAASVRQHWESNGRADLLVMSFHGIPQEYADKGDPYPRHCATTGGLLAKRLGLSADEYKVTFQSRFGPKRWLTPYTDETLMGLPGKGVKKLDLVCPGFAVDCLETLEENAMENRDIFLEAGGETFRYIPCLNDAPAHIEALRQLVLRHSAGW